MESGRISKNILIFACVLCAAIVAAALVICVPRPGKLPAAAEKDLEVLYAKEQKSTPFGGAAALSEDGRLLAYAGMDGVYLHDLETGKETALVKEAASGLSLFSRPAFLPGGAEVLFRASEKKRRGSGDIYEVGEDGSGLKQLVRSEEFSPGQEVRPGSAFVRIFFSARPSPDAAKLLLSLYDYAGNDYEMAVSGADGSGLKVLGPGTPLFWRSDGGGFYYSLGGAVKVFDITDGKSAPVSGLEGQILGKVSDKEVFAVKRAGGVFLVKVGSGSAAGETKWDVYVSERPSSEDEGSKSREGLMNLIFTQWSRDGKILLLYKGEDAELFKVLKPAKAGK